jgi:hypothetical protein
MKQHVYSLCDIVKTDPDIDRAKALARENDAALRRSFAALDDARRITVADLQKVYS